MDIFEVLSKYDVTVSEDSKSDFEKEFRKSFKSVAELNKVKSDLASLQSKLDEQSDFATREEGYKSEIDKYKAEVDSLKFASVLDKSLAGVEFSSSRVRESIISEIKSKGFTEKDGVLDGVSDYLKELYSKEPSSFKSVDTSIHTWGSSTSEKEEKEEKKSYLNRIL